MSISSLTILRLPGLWLMSALVLAAFAPSAHAAIRLDPFLSGFSSPLYITSAHDGRNRLYVVEQPGTIKVVDPGSTVPTVFLDIRSRVLSGGERGLLGLAFHPQYASNFRFFVNYTRQTDGATVIAEYRWLGDPFSTLATERIFLVVAQPFANHNGGMIEFGRDGYLYIGMGDGGDANDPGRRAQNVNELLGKILRIDVDHPDGPNLYTSPPDNPFSSAITGRDEIYAVGMRNPFRFSFDRLTGELYVGDVGQNALEEVDIVTRGGNYGWRVYEGTQCTGLDPALCNPANFTAPIAQYGHSGGRCSITGGYVYRGSLATLPSGTYIFGDYCTGEIFSLVNGAPNPLLDTTLSISSFGEDEAGELYVVDLGGTVYRVVSTTPPSAANFEGLWYKAPAESESGWGINLAHQGDVIFLTWFTYDANGKAWWLTMQADKVSDGVYSGALLESRGPPFNAIPFSPEAVTRNAVGMGTLTFTGPGSGSFDYTVNGVHQTKIFVRQVFGPVPMCIWGAQPNLALATNYQDLWYASPAESESGWGVNFTHQGDTIFATWFTYDFDGTPLWLSVTASKVAPAIYSGPLVRTSGPAFNAVPFDPTLVGRAPVGTLAITFTNGNAASYAYAVTLPGRPTVTQTKTLTRQVFRAPGTVCQ